MRKKIFFFNGCKSGGAEIVTLNIAKLIDKELHNPKVIFAGLKKDFDEIKVQQDIEFDFLEVPKFKFAVLKLYKFLNKNAADFYFTSLHGISIPLLIASFFLRDRKIIVRQSFMPERYSKWSLTSIVIRLIYPLAFRIIAQTDEMKFKMIDHYNLNSKKIVVLNNPIDYSKIEKGIKNGNPFFDFEGSIFVAVGNIRHVKGHDILLKAFKKVFEIKSNIHLFIIGKFQNSDNYFQELSNYVKNHGLENRVHFVGFSNNPYKYLYNADSFILPSRSEGLPNVLIEALYLKKPVVATQCIPFIDRTIINGINGYKVENENIEEMAEAMIKSLQLEVKKSSPSYKPTTSQEIKSLFT